VDILVTSMLVNFLLMAVSVLTLPRRNPALARSVTVLPNPRQRRMVAGLGVMVLAAFLAVHTWKDLTGLAQAWYFRSTPVWAVVMGLGSLIYWREVRGLRRSGVDLRARFAALPAD
jgi:basic amino acid/polyamine antiporter, APA family